MTNRTPRHLRLSQDSRISHVLSAPPPSLNDVAVLIDGSPVPRADSLLQDAQAEALKQSLDACVRLGITGNALLVVVRQDDTPAQQFVATYPARPAMLKPEGHAPPTDAIPKPFTLLIQPGVAPDAEVLTRALQALHAQTKLAAATGAVHRTDGTIETHIVPTALHGGATLFRTEQLRKAGGFSRLLAPSGAADLDLTCRLLREGYTVQRFADFVFDRSVWPAVMPSVKQTAAALRDALIVQERYLPKSYRRALRRDMLRRTRELLANPETASHLVRGLQDARRWAQWERRRGRSTLNSPALEALLGWSALKQRVALFAKEHRIKRVVLAGWHPHLFGFLHAARSAHLTVDAIADDTHLDAPSPHYRGVPVAPMNRAISPATQAVFIADLHPATSRRTAAAEAECYAGPIMFPQEMSNLPEIQEDSRSSQRVA